MDEPKPQFDLGTPSWIPVTPASDNKLMDIEALLRDIRTLLAQVLAKL